MSRLLDAEALHDLQCFAGYHLGQQYHTRIDIERAKSCTELQRLRFTPQIFGLIPRSALFRADPEDPIKSDIHSHLENVGVETTDLLIDIVKDFADNFFRTRISELEPRLRQRKATISDLRQRRDLYRRIRERQGARCACCGVTFLNGPLEETLDHIIPWRLGGDPPGGWNWQLLCRRCNGAKSTLLTACATREYHNWVFDDLMNVHNTGLAGVSEQGRYVALRLNKACRFDKCRHDATSAALSVVQLNTAGLPVLDHIGVLCEHHVSGAFVLA